MQDPTVLSSNAHNINSRSLSNHSSNHNLSLQAEVTLEVDTSHRMDINVPLPSAKHHEPITNALISLYSPLSFVVLDLCGMAMLVSAVLLVTWDFGVRWLAHG
jgi:hypothetical protein